MDKHEQLKYVHQLHLEGLRKTPSGFNCRCIICGDSHKSKSKKRLWLLTEKNSDTIIVFCHNCGYSSGFKHFIKEVNPSLYLEYCEEEKQEYIKKLKNGSLFQRPKSNDFKYKDDLKLFELNKDFFKPVIESEKHLEYCNKRKLKVDDILYSTARNKPYSDMLIFPFRYNEKLVHGFMGRSIKEKRFHIFSPSDSFKVYNFFSVDKAKPVYVTESIIDSMFVENSIAMVGADLSERVRAELSQPIFILDHDETGYKKTLKYLEHKEQCFIWPRQLKIKDINELILDENYSNINIMELIKNNVVSGINGITKLKMLKGTYK